MLNYVKCSHTNCSNKGHYNYEKNGSSYCYYHKKFGMIPVNETCVIS